MIAVATDDPSWYVDAALLAMRAGDRFAAQSWLREAFRGGLVPELSILWDAGLTGEILDALGPYPAASDAALAADATWIEGDRARALTLWNAALVGTSNPSWRTLAAVAALQSPGDASLAAARDLVARYRSQPEALRYAAAILIREGRSGEAVALAPSLERNSILLPEALGLELESAKQGEGRFVARAIRLAEEHRGEVLAREFALRVLLAHGRWDEYLILHDGASKEDRADSGWWYWAMVADILRKDFVAAEARAREATPGIATLAVDVAFAQGLVASLRDHGDAAETLFRAALDLSTDGRERAAVLKEIGRLEASAGRRVGALTAFNAAEEADPGDVEARLLASGLLR